MGALGQLQALAEDASAPSRELDCALALALDGFWLKPDEHRGDLYCKRDSEGVEMHPGQGADMLVPRYSADAQVMLNLIARRLPAWKISLYVNHLTADKNGLGCRASLHSHKRQKSPEGFRWPKINAECFLAPTPALALLVAFVRASLAVQAETPL